MEDVKKRGGGDVDEETTIPKKRGRPAKLNKVQKIPSGRGRGRPAKNVTATSKKNSAADDSDEEGNDVDTTNGSTPRSAGKKEKLTEIGNAKGRGRAKNPPKSDEDEIGDNDDEQLSDYKPGSGSASKKVGRKAKSPKKSEAPKKITKSDDDDDEESDDEKSVEEKPIGRGQGRPKKAIAVVTKRPAEIAANGGGGAGVPKKRGRSAIVPVATPAKSPGSTKGRGRPKPIVVADSLSEDGEEEDSSNEENEKGKPEDDDDKDDSDDDDHPDKSATA